MAAKRKRKEEMIKPYFQKEDIKIYHGNHLDIMKEMSDDYIDLTVTSPPYDDLRNYKGYSFNFKKIAKELYRTTKDGGIVVWIVNDATIKGSETGTSFRQALYFKELGFNLHDTMIYEKNGCSFPSVNRYYQTFEYMFIFSKRIPKTVNLITDRENQWPCGSWGKSSGRGKNGELKERSEIPFKEYGVRFNIWRIYGGRGFSTKDEIAYEHPAIFPEGLAEDHILSWSDPGDLVFDPMCGSGTTLKMAEKNGRRTIGIDCCKEYCEITRKRIQKQITDRKRVKQRRRRVIRRKKG